MSGAEEMSPVSIPFDYSQHQIIIRCSINDGTEDNFLVDTGASETLIDRHIAARQYLAKQGEVEVVSASGMVTVQTTTIARLKLGKLIANNVEARIVDLAQQSKHLGRHIAGIIGMNLIGKFVLTIDYGKPALTFVAAGTLPANERAPSAVSVPLAVDQAPLVNAMLNGKENITFLLDTGAAANTLPPSAAKNLSGEGSTIGQTTEGEGLDGKPLKLAPLVVDTVKLGTLVAHKIAFTFPVGDASRSNTDSSPAGFFQRSNSGILGNPFWQNFIVTINWKNKELLLAPNPAFPLRNAILQELDEGDNRLVVHRDYRAAESHYQKALAYAKAGHAPANEAKILGRLGNLYRIMAKDLGRREHAKVAYNYFVQAATKAKSLQAEDIEGRILGDWSLLYSDNGQAQEAKQMIDRALFLAPNDANVIVDYAVHLYRFNSFSEMQKYIERALALDPSNWQALWYQVKLSEKFFDTPQEVSSLQEILRYYPASKTAADKLHALDKNAAGKAGNVPINMIIQPEPAR